MASMTEVEAAIAAALLPIRNEIDSLTQRVTDLETNSKNVDVNRKVQAIKKSKPPKPFEPGPIAGREARWAAWAFQFGGYFGEQVDHGEEFLEWVQKTKSEIKPGDVDDFDEMHSLDSVGINIDAALYKELRQLCVDGEAYTIVRNLHKGKRGAEAWRRLGQRFGPGGASRAQVIEEKLMRMEWPKDDAEAGALLDQIESLVTEWEMIKARSYPEDTKIAQLKGLLPDKYHTEVSMHEDQYATYQDLREFVLRMAHLKREERQRDTRRKGGDPVNVINEKLKALEKQYDMMQCAVWGEVEDPFAYGDPWQQRWHGEDSFQPEASSCTHEHAHDHEPENDTEELNLMKGKGKGKGGKDVGKGGMFAGGWQKGGGKNYGGKGGSYGPWRPWNSKGGKGGSTVAPWEKGAGKGFGKAAWSWSPWMSYGQKGGGQAMRGFQGYCNHCGEYGHSLKWCPKKDEEMARFRAQRGGAHVLQDHPDEAGGEAEEEFALLEGKTQEMDEVYAIHDHGGWVKEQMIMDSGAAASFLRNKGFEHIPIEKPKGDEQRKRWVTASGNGITHKGVSQVHFHTKDGAKKKMRVKRSDQIDNNIGSVSEIADRENLVVFTKTGGAVIKDPGMQISKWLLSQVRDKTVFERNRNVYTLDMWIKKPIDSKPDKCKEKCAMFQESPDDTTPNSMLAVNAVQYRKFVEQQVVAGFGRQGA